MPRAVSLRECDFDSCEASQSGAIADLMNGAAELLCMWFPNSSTHAARLGDDVLHAVETCYPLL